MWMFKCGELPLVTEEIVFLGGGVEAVKWRIIVLCSACSKVSHIVLEYILWGLTFQ